MTAAFSQKKQKILASLSVPDSSYTDLSPKGSVDAGIRDLIEEINSLPGLVTTSSCAGRVSVFLEGKKRKSGKAAENGEEGEKSEEVGPTGKGGGKWLFVSHDPVEVAESQASNAETVQGRGRLHSKLGLERRTAEAVPEGASLVHLKFEPMILHILTASLQEANSVLSAANQAGFRESGALGLTTKKDGTATPMVAVRCAGLSFDSVIGFEANDGRILSLVDEAYLEVLFRLGNQRFEANKERIGRFQSLLLTQQLSLKSK